MSKMAAMNIEEISRKRSVSRYNPNSYRIFCEDIGNGSVPEQMKYQNEQAPMQQPSGYMGARPPLPPQYNTDMMMQQPQQQSFARTASFSNEPQQQQVSSFSNPRRVAREDEKRWWEWKTDSEDNDPLWKHKKRSQSSSNLKGRGESSGESFQTTYQKEHGYLNDLKQRAPVDPSQGGYSLNPDDYRSGYGGMQNGGSGVGAQRLAAREEGSRSAAMQSRGQSLWEIMHPTYAPDSKPGSGQPNGLPPRGPPQVYEKPPSGNQRRDPIGYFDESRYDSNSFVQQQQQQQRQSAQMKYTPSWSNGYTTNEPMANNPLAHAHQVPIAVNGNGVYGHD